MPVNHYNTHISNRETSIIIPKFDLQKGMIINCRYRKLDNKYKNYMFVVLNGNYRGKVHLLSLNEMTVKQLNDMARRIGIRVIPKFKKRGLDFEKLIMTESSNRFYHSKISSKMDLWYNNSYRTFFAKKMGIVQLIDYKFDKDVEAMING